MRSLSLIDEMAIGKKGTVGLNSGFRLGYDLYITPEFGTFLEAVNPCAPLFACILLLPDLLQEIEFHAATANALHVAKRLPVFPPAVVVRIVIRVELNEAIVDHATRVRRLDNGGALDLAEAVCRTKLVGKFGKNVVRMSGTAPISQDGWVCHRRVQAVDMPPQTTKSTGDDGPVVLSGAITAVAQDWVAVIVTNPEEVRCLIVAAFSAMGVSLKNITEK